MTNANDIPMPERPTTDAATPSITQAAVAAIAEPSMFDTPEWTQNGNVTVAAQVNFAGVRFQPVGKVYHYLASGYSLKVGDWVIVDTQRGKQMGQVATVKPPRDRANLDAFKSIERPATGRDMAMRHFYENKELEAMIACRAESNALGLPIKIVKAEYSFDGQTLTFLYSSDQEERVETNDLRQVMSRLYRARIETRQISPREVAKIIGGMGACGIEQRCCSRFLTDFSPISIKHAKEQGLSLNPHDITGMCGRLRCCLIYEYEQYVEARRQLPKKNTIVGTPSGQGKVIDLLPLRDSVLVLVGEAEAAKAIVVHREQIVPLEELKRLQEKAASGTCDKHEGGNCDCGKNAKPADAAAGASAAQATPDTPAPSGAAPERTRAGNRPDKNKKHKKNPGSQPGAQAGQGNRPAGNASSGAGRQTPGQRESQPVGGAGNAHKRHPLRPKPIRSERTVERPTRESDEPARRSGPEAAGQPADFFPPVDTGAPTDSFSESGTGSDADVSTDTSTKPGATRPTRRPLRRPLPRHNRTPPRGS
jgi:cell fate regulator YaaT (PSP1 superfamily)